MTLNTQFIRGANPVWSFVDLNGQIFDDTFWMWTLTNTIPYTPQAVYTDVAGTIPYTDPVQFQANGTLPNNLYWDDTLVYRLEFRQHIGLGPPTQADPLIYLVENYIPNGTGITPGTVEGIVTDNQISNPQFATINFTSPLTLASVTNTTINIAPDWDLILTGTGSVTVTQVPLNTTNPTPTNAPYALQIDLGSGPWTAAPVLRQRFHQNGQNWQNQYAASSITAMTPGSSQVLTMRLEASNGANVTLLQQPILTNNFQQFTDNKLIGPFINLDLPPDAYMQYSIYLPYSGVFYITSLQLLISGTSQNYAYEQSTVDRQIDNLFHYYKPQLAYKPIPSYLVGWDFKTNPAQFFGDTVTAQAVGANKSYYAWDQTIIFQSVNNGFTVARGASGLTSGSFQLTCAIGGQPALIQYLDTRQTRELLAGNLSVELQGLCSAASLTGKITLWAATGTLPVISSATFNSIVATLDSTGFPATTNSPGGGGSWTQVPNQIGVDPTFTLTSTLQTFDFNGWNLNNATLAGTATYFAIVIGFPAMTAADSINLNYVSLCAGDIATQPAPKTATEVLSDCELYYEKSYDASTVAGTITSVNSLVSEMGSENDGTDTYGSNSNFSLMYRNLKRSTAPTIALYAPTSATINQVLGVLTSWIDTAAQTPALNSTSIWTLTKGNKSALYAANANFVNTLKITSWTQGANCYISYHYVIDARLGVV